VILTSNSVTVSLPEVSPIRVGVLSGKAFYPKSALSYEAYQKTLLVIEVRIRTYLLLDQPFRKIQSIPAGL